MGESSWTWRLFLVNLNANVLSFIVFIWKTTRNLHFCYLDIALGYCVNRERRTKPPEVNCSQNSAAACRASTTIDVSAPTSLSPLLPSPLWGGRTCVISSTWAGSALLWSLQPTCLSCAHLSLSCAHLSASSSVIRPPVSPRSVLYTRLAAWGLQTWECLPSRH